MNCTCIGSGAFGMAIAKVLSEKKENNVIVWSHDEAWKKTVMAQKEFTVAGNTYALPDNISISINLIECVKSSDIIFLLVSTPFIENILNQLRSLDMKNKYLFIGTKGMLDKKPYFLTDYFQSELKPFYVGNFAGPNLAQDMLINAFCSITFSAKTKKIQKVLRDIFPEAVILHYTKSKHSLELASVMKNIYAIGSGILMEKTNSKSAVHAYLAQSYNEMLRLLDDYFFLDYDFLPIDITGDFYLTCTMEESRNQRYGRAIIHAKEEEFLNENTVEGVENLSNVYIYLQKKGAIAPLFQALYKIVIEKQDSNILEEAMHR